jgi:hypothetical protein
MNTGRRTFFLLLAGLVLTAAAWTMPALAQQQKPQPATGKISSMQKEGQGTLQDSFTLDITEDQTIVLFMVPQTKVTGTMKVGANADVTYVFDQNGNKIAVTVNVK